MDTEILKTFIEVARTRHFARAAENLFVTQAGVSARISQLETLVGARLFSRARNNIQLTSAGHRLLPYAETVTGTWNRAVLDVGGSDDAALVALGCLPSLGEIFLDALLASLHAYAEGTIIQIEQLNTVALVARVREQSLNVALLYEPPRAKDLNAEHLTDIELVMVSTDSKRSVHSDINDYVYVDWGTSFSIAHDTQMRRPPKPVARVDTPGPAHRLLLSSGGTAYLSRRLVESDLAAGRLFVVEDAPVLTRSVYILTSNSWTQERRLDVVLDRIRELAGPE